MLLAALCGLLCVGLVHGDSGLILAAYSQAASGQAENANMAESGSLSYAPTGTDYLMQGVHTNGPAASYIADKANFVNVLSVFLNAKSIQDMTFDNFADLTQRISDRIDNVCPLNQYFDVDCSVIDLDNRPINNLCNNLENPHWGTPKIAQLRLAPAWWENSGIINHRATGVGVIRALDPLGVQFEQGDRLRFRLEGNAGLKIVVLAPNEKCDEISMKRDSEAMLPGILHIVEPLGKNVAVCTMDRTFKVGGVGNQIVTSGDCEGPFRVCYQPAHIEVNIKRNPGETSTIAVDGEILDKYAADKTLYEFSNPQAFWIRIGKDGTIKVGHGTECDSRTTILSAATPILSLLKELDHFRHSIAVGVLDDALKESVNPRVDCYFPVNDRVIIEASTGVTGSSNLNDFPFIYSDGSLRFGIEFFDSAVFYEMTLHDDTNNARVRLSLGSRNQLEFFQEGKKTQTVELDPTFNAIPEFEDGAGEINRHFSAFWISWIANRVYVGVGNVVGKGSFDQIMILQVDTFQFTTERVLFRTRDSVPARFIFDLIQWTVPRSTSLSGAALPSARDVSLGVHTNIGGTTEWSSRLTMAVMQMGQFIDHDIIATPAEEVNHQPIMCCVAGVPISPLSRFCFNIDITSATDPNGSQGEFPDSTFQCMPFVRSSATLNCDLFDPLRDLRSREQLNVLTSYVDGSNIYGSEPEEAEELRELADHSGARLASTEGGRELPTTTEAGEAPCNNGDHPEFLCHKAGDFRVSEQPGLSSIHTLWLREHNRVVDELLNFGYSESTADEREELYQQARRIVIAEYQNIVYEGYLRSFIDDEIFNHFALGQGQGAYDPRKNAGVFNEWGIANRIGHTWVNGFLLGTSSESLSDNFFNPTITHVQGSDVLIRNLYQQQCPETDRQLETDITEHLFRVGADALDLAALNVQRGRDHGVSYCRTREALGLTVPNSFNNAVSTGVFTQETADVLEAVYECVCDIDLFTAIVSEQPMNQRFSTSNSPVGETLNHIQALFFHNAKFGDRYWYEFPDARFNDAQIAAIKTATLSRVICDNTADVDQIQIDAYIHPGVDNPLSSCDDEAAIPKLDLRLFRKRSTVLEKAPEKQEVGPLPQRNAETEAAADGDATERDIGSEIEHLLEVLKKLEDNN